MQLFSELNADIDGGPYKLKVEVRTQYINLTEIVNYEMEFSFGITKCITLSVAAPYI